MNDDLFWEWNGIWVYWYEDFEDLIIRIGYENESRRLEQGTNRGSPL
jgi:hypothetical protein